MKDKKTTYSGAIAALLTLIPNFIPLSDDWKKVLAGAAALFMIIFAKFAKDASDG